jgi:outer membrane protein TolC
VAGLLAQPLSPDTAVQIALLNNPGLQAAYAELGIAEADRVQAGRIPNPLFTYQHTRGGVDFKIERMLGFSLMALLTLPIRSGIESRRFEAAKLQAAEETVAVAVGARRACFDAVAAQQTLHYMKQVVEAAEASRDLAQRMQSIGNWSKLGQAREQLFYAEATTQLARAQQNAVATREALSRILGLWGQDLDFKLAERLPELPAQPRAVEDAERTAIEQRLDVRAGKLALEALANNLGLSKATRFINIAEFGPAQVRESGSSIKNGYEIIVEVPLFDWGGARVAKAQTLYLQSVNRLRETAIDARSEVRESYHAYRSAFDVARHYRDEIVPLRKKISDEQLLRYNGMLIGVFDLIADARDQVASVNAYIGALRDYWIAEAGLQQAMLGKVPNKGRAESAAFAMPAAVAGGH